MGFFSNKLHSVGKMVGNFAHRAERAVDSGFGAARRVVHGAASVGNKVKSFAKRIDDATGGLAGKALDMVPGGSQAKQLFNSAVSGVNKADQLINRAEGAVNVGKKRVREGFAKAQAVGGKAAAAADSAVDTGRRVIKKARTMKKDGLKETARKLLST
jgi:hypothetical protein